MGLRVDFINWFMPYVKIFALYPQLLRIFFEAYQFGVGSERSMLGAKQFLKWTLGLSAESRASK